MKNKWIPSSRISQTGYNYCHLYNRSQQFSVTTSDRPFRILGVQQIAIGSTDKEGQSKLWKDIFGFEAESTHRIEKENVEEDILRVGASKSPFAVEIDLMQPIDPGKSPKVRVLLK